MTIAVLGSINMDLVARTPRLPQPAESLIGYDFFTAPGGKGANQAVATAQLGLPTRMVGRVGQDDFGQALQQNLFNNGIDVTAVFVDNTISSGVAIIAVDDTAQNSIIVIPGANNRVDQTDVQRLDAALADVKLLLLQLEVPLAVTVASAQLGQSKGLTVILDPAPVQDIPDELYGLVDIITPNEIEAGYLVGFPVKTVEDAKQAANVFLERGAKTAIIKLGAQGAYYASRLTHTAEFVPAFKVDAIDTVAAGDAFNGGLATALVEGLPLPTAVRWGAATGALSTTKAGAQPSMPTRDEFDLFLAENMQSSG